MRFTITASHRAPHQLQHQAALAEGLLALGHEPVLHRAGGISTLHVACWGWRKGQELRAAGHEVLVMERGYLGDRFAWTSLAWNGLNGRGVFPPAPDDGGTRFRQHHAPLAPWRGGPGYALIVGQVPGDMSLQGRNLEPWYAEMAQQATAAGLEPVFRQHPVAARSGYRQGPRGIRQNIGALDEALAGAAIVVTFNSNTGVDAAVAGVPVVVDNEGSMAWPVASQSLSPIRPDRTRWAHDLAHKQFLLSEIADGSALRSYL